MGVQVPRGSLPAFLPWYGVLRNPRDHLQLHHEVRRGHQEGPVRQHCPVRRHHHVPWHCWEDPSWPPSPPSSRCGSLSRSMTSLAPALCTGSASKQESVQPPATTLTK